MRMNLIAAVSAALLVSTPVAVQAASGTVTGGAGGAITGAIVAGPVGAIVGGVIGAVIGTAIDPPPAPVVSYVATQTAPPVFLQGDVVVGAVLPSTVVLYPVPPEVYVPGDARLYAYAVVNGYPVVVDARTRVILSVVG
jgi:hypothetical protein